MVPRPRVEANGWCEMTLGEALLILLLALAAIYADQKHLFKK